MIPDFLVRSDHERTAIAGVIGRAGGNHRGVATSLPTQQINWCMVPWRTSAMRHVIIIAACQHACLNARAAGKPASRQSAQPLLDEVLLLPLKPLDIAAPDKRGKGG